MSQNDIKDNVISGVVGVATGAAIGCASGASATGSIGAAGTAIAIAIATGASATGGIVVEKLCYRFRPVAYAPSALAGFTLAGAAMFLPLDDNANDKNTHLSNHDNVTPVIAEMADIQEEKATNYTLAPMLK